MMSLAKVIPRRAHNFSLFTFTRRFLVFSSGYQTKEAGNECQRKYHGFIYSGGRN